VPPDDLVVQRRPARREVPILGKSLRDDLVGEDLGIPAEEILDITLILLGHLLDELTKGARPALVMPSGARLCGFDESHDIAP